MGRRPSFDYANIANEMHGPDDKDWAFLGSLDRWSEVAGIDPAVPAAQFLLETDNGKSIRWNRDLNASGMGIVADNTPQPFKIESVDESARLFVQCLYSLVNRKAHPDVPLSGDVLTWFNNVWLKKVMSPAMPDVETVADLGLRYKENGDSRATWSWEKGTGPTDAYGKKLVSRLDQFYPNLPAPAEGVPPVANDPEILKQGVKYAYVYKRREGQGFDYGNRGPIDGVFTHETQGRGSGTWYQGFFTCWTQESCDKYGICEDGERCGDALVDWFVDRDGVWWEFQDPFNTDRIPYASGGKTKNWNDPVGIYINNNYSNVNDSFAAIEFEKTDNEHLTPAQIKTAGRIGAYVLAKRGKKKREFWSMPNHSSVFTSTNCAQWADDRVKFEAECDRQLSAYWAGTTPGGGPEEPIPPTYAPPAKVPALEQYMNADPNTVPAVVNTEGSDFIFVNDTVKVTQDTPRLQRASVTALHTGGDVKKGEDFTAKFLVKASAGDWYYLTRFWTRIQVKHTTRSKDA